MSLQLDRHEGGPYFYHPDFNELLDYFGPLFRPGWCASDDEKAIGDFKSFENPEAFNAATLSYIYQNIGLMTTGVQRPYIAMVLQMTADRYATSVLEVGPGGGQLGLALHTLGYKVSFAEIMGQSVLFLEWRLRRRGLALPIYILGQQSEGRIPKHDLVVCFDVLEHIRSKADRLSLLEKMGRWGSAVFTNIVVDDRDTGGMHAPLDIDEIQKDIARLWPKKYSLTRFYEGKQWFLVYGEAVEGIESGSVECKTTG